MERLRRQLGYSFKDQSVLRRALTHVAYDRHKHGDHNEVLEFLGDAVLDHLRVADREVRVHLRMLHLELAQDAGQADLGDGSACAEQQRPDG